MRKRKNVTYPFNVLEYALDNYRYNHSRQRYPSAELVPFSADEIESMIYELVSGSRYEERYKKILQYYFKDDLTMKETGKNLGISADRVRQHLLEMAVKFVRNIDYFFKRDL